MLTVNNKARVPVIAYPKRTNGSPLAQGIKSDF
jgi:hypothetical protein